MIYLFIVPINSCCAWRRQISDKASVAPTEDSMCVKITEERASSHQSSFVHSGVQTWRSHITADSEGKIIF